MVALATHSSVCSVSSVPACILIGSPAAVVDPVTLGRNLYLLIGFWFCAFTGVILLVVIWTLVKLLLWRGEKQLAKIEKRKQKLAPNGEPRPPLGRGMCDSCSRTFDQVYYLQSGQRLCQTCYDHKVGQNVKDSSS